MAENTLGKVVELLKTSIETENKLVKNQQTIAINIKMLRDRVNELEARVKELESYAAGYNARGYHD